jgi:hypothetical protein
MASLTKKTERRRSIRDEKIKKKRHKKVNKRAAKAKAKK